MEEFRKQGVKLPEKPAGSAWDSNIITPGTAFMHRLSVALQYYVHLRLNNDAGWRGITVGSLILALLGRIPRQLCPPWHASWAVSELKS